MNGMPELVIDTSLGVQLVRRYMGLVLPVRPFHPTCSYVFHNSQFEYNQLIALIDYHFFVFLDT